MTRPLFRSELLGEQLAYLLTIEWGGVVYRWSSEPAAPVDANSVIRLFDGQLGAVDLTLSFELFSAAPELVSVPFELVFPVDVAARVARGFDLASATGELSLWVDGTTWEDRRVVLAGDVVNPSYGAEGEPVSFSLEEPPFSDAGAMMPSSAAMSADTWSDRNTDHSDNDGFVYPMILGAPGWYDTITSGPTGTSGSQALVVKDTAAGGAGGEDVVDKLLIAGHRVIATNVRIFSDGGGNATLAVVHEQDGLGRTVATVDVSGQTDAFRDTPTFWVVWQNGASGAVMGGYVGVNDEPFLEGAGSVLLLVLQRSTLKIDVGRCQVAATKLDHIKIGAMIDEAVTPWDWLTDNLLPLLPVTLVNGPDGVYPVVWDYNATADDAVLDLTEGEQVERISSIEYEQTRRDVSNELRFSFAKRLKTGEWKRQIVHKANPSTSVRGEHGSVYAWVSENRYGNRVEKIESDIMYREPSAGAVLAWMIRARGFATRTVAYVGGIDLAWIELGAVVTITDTDVSLTSAVAIVSAMSIAPAETTVTLTLIEDVARDLKTIS